MIDILANEYYSAFIILISQIISHYLRTINVIYTAEGKVLPAIITGNGVGLISLLIIAIGANSILEGQIIPIISFLIGGTIGTYFGMKKSK